MKSYKMTIHIYLNLLHNKKVANYLWVKCLARDILFLAQFNRYEVLAWDRNPYLIPVILHTLSCKGCTLVVMYTLANGLQVLSLLYQSAVIK